MELVPGRIFAFVAMVAVCAAIILQIERAKKGALKVEIRKIPALDALNEAIGRATEMGRPVHFSAGVGNLTNRGNSVMLASLDYLSYIARECAKFGTKFIATVAQGDVYAVSTEVTKAAYMQAGAPDKYTTDTVRYVTPDQYAYAGAITGILNREKVATNVIIGHFANEALFIAEVAHQVGCIQISGTTNAYQLPFFVAACDYTLLGEEIIAGGAYYSQDPIDLGALSGQDFAKAVAAVLVIVGIVSGVAGSPWLINLIKK